MQADITLWVLSDGRKGHENQSIGVAEALARRIPAAFETKHLRLAPWAATLPATLLWRLVAGAGGGAAFVLAEGAEHFAPPWPEAVVGAGRRIAPITAWLKRRHGVPAVQIMEPHMPAAAFDALVIPGHDLRAGAVPAPNVLETVGAPNRLSASAITEAGEPWAARFGALRRPRLAVMIGGPSRSARFTGRDEAALQAALLNLADTHGLIISGSPRTPETLMQRLRARLKDSFIWDGSGENPYPGLLGHVDAVLVTEDSVSMASEAASTGLPVHVFPITRVAPKIRRFHESLARRGASRVFSGAIEAWEYEPLAEADRVAGELIAGGLLRGASL